MYYLYGMRLRPAMPGAQPRHFEIVTDRFLDLFCRKYYDIIAYQRRLSEEEIRDYELDFLASTEIIDI